MGFNDAKCVCGRRFGWAGRLTDKPPCPHCGKPPDTEALKKLEAECDARIEKMMANEVRQNQRGMPSDGKEAKEV
jgi:hypothetical protein